ncbi:DUF6233 domain-containing protein [Streptomyces sp. NPDC052095]|uniref:DUF6233 domain-containing protein n=1 Tax=unclassified Streptomyces TaxID=2593676 RepID=UPI00344CCA28
MSAPGPASRLDKLKTLEKWLDWQLRQTRSRIRELEAQERKGRREQAPGNVEGQRKQAPRAEEQQGLPPRPQASAWAVTDGARTPQAEVHRGDCWAMGKQLRPVSREEAMAALADGVAPCDVCRPDRVLGAP